MMNNNKFYKKWWFWLIIVIIILATLGFNSSNITNSNENNDNNMENNIIDNSVPNNKPSEDNYKKYVYEIFDNYYDGEYNFSGDSKDWNIVNLETSDLYRTKLEGIAILNNQAYKFIIIMEFTDSSYSSYTVTNFEIGKNKII